MKNYVYPRKIRPSSDFDIRYHIFQLTYYKVTRLYNDLDKTHTLCSRCIPCLHKLKHTKPLPQLFEIIWRQSKSSTSNHLYARGLFHDCRLMQSPNVRKLIDRTDEWKGMLIECLCIPCLAIKYDSSILLQDLCILSHQCIFLVNFRSYKAVLPIQSIVRAFGLTQP